jgi:hypothetical protein
VYKIKRPFCRIVLCWLFLFAVPMCGQQSSSNPQKCQNGAESLFDSKTLNGWGITLFGTEGPVYVKDKSIILGTGDGCTGITINRNFPTVNYEVTLEAKRINGSDFFCGLTFPVMEEFATLIVGGWGGTVVGLSCIDGFDASENETSGLKKFIRNRWYFIRLQVTGESIKTWIDDILFVDHIMDDRPLSIRSEVLLSRPFGITSWQTTGAIRNICLKHLH